MVDQTKRYDVLIAGQGAAAFSAALYAARYQMSAIIVGGIFGGETATGGTIENYPGYPEIDGFDLMLKFREQVDKYEVPVIDENVTSMERSEDEFTVTTEGDQTFTATTAILAIGRERRRLWLDHEEEWTGRGVSFCSTCDAPMHRGNTVAVVGGGNAAVEGAVLLSKFAEQVYLVYRQNEFTRPEPINLELLAAAKNVEQVLGTNVLELKGDDGLTGVVLDNEVRGSKDLELNGLFIEIGADPRSELAVKLGADVNDGDEVIVDKEMRTKVHGLFAAGDLTNASGDLKQTITAAAQGAIAATAAYSEVSTH
ncbi:MAG: FAD-dependent oxidoreductase, partial [SAR202 cluster bacterium]|nr:FAD-dependent oxidoreductase [SAR202 cluster bacterium]